MRTTAFFRIAPRAAVASMLLLHAGQPCDAAGPVYLPVKIGGTTVQLVAPADYLNHSASSDPVRKIAGHFCPPNNRLLAVFARADFEQAPQARPTFPTSDYALVEVSRDLIRRDISVAEFVEIKGTIHQEQDRIFSVADPELKQFLDRLNRDAQKAWGEKIALHLEEPMSLGISDEGANHITLLILTRMQAKANGVNEAGSSKMIGSMSLILVNHKVLFLYAYRAYNGERSIRELQQFASSWVRDLKAANQP